MHACVKRDPLFPPCLCPQALAPHENLIEILVSEATLSPAAELAPDASTFVAWDFFLHDSQATPVLPGSSPSFNTTVRYIVEADSFLLEYLSKQHLALEVFEARGWDVRALGVAHMPLKTLLQDLEVGSGETWDPVVLNLHAVAVLCLVLARLLSVTARELMPLASKPP